MSPQESALLLSLYLIGFAAVHSLLAGTWAKNQAGRAFGKRAMRWYRFFFTLFSTSTLIPLLSLFYLFPGKILYLVPSPWRWIMIAGQLAAAFALAKTLMEAGPLQFLGIRPDEGRSELIVQGFYCRVRNPLFLFALIFLWLSPIMTENLLVLYLIATVYFFLGSIHEERMLAEKLGDGYRDYQRRVPRIVPRLSCRYPETKFVAPEKDQT